MDLEAAEEAPPVTEAHQGREQRELCRAEEDYVSMTLFEELLKDEEGHIDFLETQLDLLQAIGVENYGQLQSGSADHSKGHDD